METYNSRKQKHENDFKPRNGRFLETTTIDEDIVLDKFVPRGISFNSLNCVKASAFPKSKRYNNRPMSVVCLNNSKTKSSELL